MGNLMPVVLVGATAWYLWEKKKEEDEELELLGAGEYGIFGLSKRERRDRKTRKYEKAMDRYTKCVSKRGASHKRCQRLLARAKKKLAKSEELSEELEAKGKTTMRSVASKKVRSSARPSRGGRSSGGGGGSIGGNGTFEPSDDALVEEAYYEEDYESEGMGMLPIVLGGVVLLAGGGALIYTLTR